MLGMALRRLVRPRDATKKVRREVGCGGGRNSGMGGRGTKKVRRGEVGVVSTQDERGGEWGGGAGGLVEGTVCMCACGASSWDSCGGDWWGATVVVLLFRLPAIVGTDLYS